MTIIAAIALGGVAAPPGGREVVTPPPLIRVPAPAPPPPPPSPPPQMVVVPPSATPRPRLPLPTPSAGAQTLAMKLLERIAMFEQGARRDVLNHLRWVGGSNRCDPANAECRAIAEEIAGREAQGRAREMREAVSRILGAQFDRTMNAEQIAASIRFFESEAGQSLIGSIVSIDESVIMRYDPTFPAVTSRREELAAEYARRTAHLPRARMTRPPPAPPSPPPVPPPPPKSSPEA